jgi:peptidoglycan/xylan/chitin deacetylase (PgdA/CDA1 family)
MTRRELVMAIGIAVVAAVLLTIAVGTVLTRGVHVGENARAKQDASSPAADDAFVAADRVPVLCYHYVRRPASPFQFARVFGYVVLSLPLLDDSELWKVSRRGFERQMEYLASRGYRTISLDELHEWQMGRRVLPAKSVVITFDDGEESVYDYVYPVLEKHGFKATMFVITSRVGTRWNGIQCLDWHRLRELERSGVFDIESHTHDLHYKVGERDDAAPVFVAASQDGSARHVNDRWAGELFDDLAKSRDQIERHIGRTPRFLAWPYGFGNPSVDQVAVDAGFTRTCALRARPNRRLDAGQTLVLSDTERFEIPRYTVTARTSLRVFREMIDGTYLPAR